MFPNHKPDTLLLSSDSTYAKRRKELLALVKQLRAIGAQADLDLPRIAVIGNQSAGKSSLVEAISGITVPRDAGTCTRCPMECRLSSSSAEWTCQISIRWEYHHTGNRLDEVEEKKFGEVIVDKSQVELALRRAQAAVLNPHIPTDKFLSLTAEQLSKESFRGVDGKSTLSFSRNVVCIDLSGPELTDLSFIDLPGIIQNADKEMVDLVENLVRSHIKGNCLILVTVPMNDDIENQKAMRIAKEEDPSGLRTIGVMTKPDTLLPSATKSRELWLNVIEGRRHPLKHGYFCSRQPDDAERLNGITSAEARAAEARFFASTSPWATSTHQGRFGTNNLVETLSKLLTGIIDTVLPQLRQEVAHQLSKCISDLEKYPPLMTEEPTSYVLGMVTAFCGEVDRYIRGHPDAATLVQANRKVYSEYKRAIRSTAPLMVPYPNAKQASGAQARQSLPVDEDDEEEDGQIQDEEAVPSAKYIYLDDVRRCIQDSVTRELPNNVPYSAKLRLIRDCQASWEPHSQDCFQKIFDKFVSTLTDIIESKLARYENLKTMFFSVLEPLIKERRDATFTHVTGLLQMERMPFTQNEHYLQDKMAKSLAHYKDARVGKAVPEALKRRRPAPQPANATSTLPDTEPSQSQSPFTFGPAGANMRVVFDKRLSQPDDASLSPKRQKQFSPFSAAPPSSSVFGFQSTMGGATSAVPPAAKPSPFGQAIPAAFTGPQAAPAQAGPSESDEVEAALAALAKIGYHVTASDLGKLNPPDMYEEELRVMAEVRAYFQVAYKRVIDYVPMSIDHLFLYAFSSELQNFLIERLGLGQPNCAARCAAYLSEDPSVVAMRDELLGKKKRLEAVQKELFDFGLA